MGGAAKISPRVSSTCAENAIVSLQIIQVCKAMGVVANISPRVSSTCAENANLSFRIIYIIPSRLIYMAIDKPSFVPSVSCRTTNSYLPNDMHAADNISHAENLQSNDCR